MSTVSRHFQVFLDQHIPTLCSQSHFLESRRAFTRSSRNRKDVSMQGISPKALNSAFTSVRHVFSRFFTWTIYEIGLVTRMHDSWKSTPIPFSRSGSPSPESSYNVCSAASTSSLKKKTLSWSCSLVTQAPLLESTLLTSFPDEVESLTAARASAGSGTEPSDALRVVNALLTQLDKLRLKKNVLVMSTSNLVKAIGELNTVPHR